LYWLEADAAGYKGSGVEDLTDGLQVRETEAESQS
jgi:hypothetical protein